MHKSRLAGFIIDCQTDELDAAAKFWAEALGYGVRAHSAADGDRYRKIETGPGGLNVEVQQVEHPSRVHLDIETDNIEAEVQRLEKLGAKRVKQLNTWWIMEAPTGQRFCVVRPQSPDLAAKGNVWD
jgi:predicted enzyme related to lactoylglutathione lyase